MNSHSESLTPRLLELLQSVRDSHDESARLELNELLRNDTAARSVMARLLVDEQALVSRLRDDSIVSILEPTKSDSLPRISGSPGWQLWRPLAAAAAGLIVGMFFTSFVFGFVATRFGSVTLVPITIANSGMEDASAALEAGLPKAAGQWGVDSAAIVEAENGIKPVEGSRMLRLQPIPRSKDVKNHASRAYHVLDLSSLGELDDEAREVQLTASFCASHRDRSSIFRIRGIALDETYEQARKDFWTKAENDDVVSVSQKFSSSLGELGWHTYSVKMPLPRGAKTLVVILAAMPPEDKSVEGSIHYLDDVHVSVITPSPSKP